MMSSFWISRIRAVGKNVPAAEVSFSQYLNVISGASDTGKSYILQCINYMLGAENPPKSVEEDAGYDTLLMELVTSTKKTYVLQRSLKQGGDFLLYEQGLDKDLVKKSGKHLAWKHNPKKTDTVSAFLLGLCDLQGTTIRTKATASRHLSFRDICRFVIISEEEIISEESPVYPSRQFIKRTENKSVFDFMVSGENASSMIVAPDIQVQKAGWRAKVELFDELISDIELEAPDSLDSLDERLERLDGRISELTAIMASNSSEIADAQSKRIGAWEARHKAASRLLVANDLVRRFSTLGDHYRSDIDRLRFLAEGDHYISQLGGVIHCPICGSLLDSHDAAHQFNDEDGDETIQSAALAEIAKLKLLLTDLDSTVNELQVELSQLEQDITELDGTIEVTDNRLATQLAPRVQVTKDELDQLLEARKEVIAGMTARSRLAQLVQQRQDLGPEPKRAKTTTNVPATVSETAGRRAFCNRLQTLLKRWRYARNGIVEFNEEMDLVVAGRPRRSHGKGIRAILQSAFTMTLMLHGKARHPGFVVLDSPLTSFRPNDRYEIDQDVQQGFFEYLSGLREGQIIVLENKDPPKSLQAKMHYEHFAGKDGEGREGFYP